MTVMENRCDMDSVAFLQQQINELTLQIGQLLRQRQKLEADLRFQQDLALLQKYNLKTPDVGV